MSKKISPKKKGRAQRKAKGSSHQVKRRTQMTVALVPPSVGADASLSASQAAGHAGSHVAGVVGPHVNPPVQTAPGPGGPPGG